MFAGSNAVRSCCSGWIGSCRRLSKQQHDFKEVRRHVHQPGKRADSAVEENPFVVDEYWRVDGARYYDSFL
jgi:hypothetical protein